MSLYRGTESGPQNLFLWKHSLFLREITCKRGFSTMWLRNGAHVNTTLEKETCSAKQSSSMKILPTPGSYDALHAFEQHQRRPL